MFAFIGAMDEEIAGIRAKLSDIQEETHAGLTFVAGSYQGQRCILVRAGIGKVNAAFCTQALLDAYPVSAVINTGIAGSLNPAIAIGDLVLCTEAYQHDMDASGFGYAPGQIPRLDVRGFTASAALRAQALQLASVLLPEVGCHEGIVLSGDQFINSREKKEALQRTFGGDCCEMEGAAIAQVCYLNQVPFLIIRAISDSADDSAGVDYAVFERQAIEHSVTLALGLIAMGLPADFPCKPASSVI